MNREQHAGDAELEALLERGRIIPPAPDVVRARAMARARATITAATPSAPPREIPARGRGLRLAVAASVALVLGAAGATAALLGRGPQNPEPSPPSSPRVVPPAPVVAPNRPAPPPVTPEATSIAKPGHPPGPRPPRSRTRPSSNCFSVLKPLTRAGTFPMRWCWSRTTAVAFRTDASPSSARRYA